MTRRPPTFSRSSAVIDEEKVRIIRQGLAAGIPASEFSRIYGISGEQVRRIGRREAWAWVPDEGPLPEKASLDLPLGREPSEEEIAKSLEKLNKMLGKS